MSPSSQATSSPHTEPESLTARLRRATAAQHRAVEDLGTMRALTSASVTRADYRAYLSRMALVYASLEPPLFAALDSSAGAQTRDLRPAPAQAARPARRLSRRGPGSATSGVGLDHPLGLSESLGGLYVLEGATLGGRVIARHLRRHLPGGLDSARFLDFHGDSASAAWKGFVAALDGLARSGAISADRVSRARAWSSGRSTASLGRPRSRTRREQGGISVCYGRGSGSQAGQGAARSGTLG